MGSLRVGDGAPVVVSEVVTHLHAYSTIVDALPEVVGIVVVHGQSFFQIDFADLNVRAGRRTTEVEEQTDGRSIGTFLQGNALTLQNEWCAALYVVALLDEEVGIASIGEFEGYARQILV